MPSFEQSAISLYILFSNYNLAISVKIRLKDASDPSTIELGPGQQLQFNIQYNSGRAKFYYTGKEVQMIDLNNGGSADDFNCPNSDNNSNNTLRYVQGDFAPSNAVDAINFDTNTYLESFEDKDGVDGGGWAIFRQTIEGNAIKATLRAL